MQSVDHRSLVAARRRERMRERLLDAALVLAAGGGVEAVTIDAVIAQAEVARGTFYKYFDTPAALLSELGVEVSDALIRTMHPFMEQLDDPAERLVVGMRTILRLARTYPLIGSFMGRVGGWMEAQRNHALFTLVGVDIEKGIRKGRFARMHLNVALNAMTGTMTAATQCISSIRMPRDFPEQTAASVLRALGIPAEEAQAMATAPLTMPSVDGNTLIGRLMSAPR